MSTDSLERSISHVSVQYRFIVAMSFVMYSVSILVVLFVLFEVIPFLLLIVPAFLLVIVWFFYGLKSQLNTMLMEWRCSYIKQVFMSLAIKGDVVPDAFLDLCEGSIMKLYKPKASDIINKLNEISSDERRLVVLYETVKSNKGILISDD